MRVPSEGQEFELQEMKFRVVVSKGARFKAEARTKQMKMINTKDKFKLFDVAYAIQSMRFKGNKLTLWAVANG